MKIRITVLAGVVALSYWGAVSAAEPLAPPSQDSPADQLAALQAKKALNRVRLDIATQEAELAKVRASAQPTLDPSAAPRPAPLPRRLREERPEPPIAEPPRVVSIVGMADKLRASVLTAGGATVAVSSGDVIDGGWVVRDIGPTAVTVAQGTRVVVLKP